MQPALVLARLELYPALKFYLTLIPQSLSDLTQSCAGSLSAIDLPFDDCLFDVLNVAIDIAFSPLHLQWWIGDDTAFLEASPQEIQRILSHEQHLKPGLQVIDLF